MNFCYHFGKRLDLIVKTRRLARVGLLAELEKIEAGEEPYEASYSECAEPPFLEESLELMHGLDRIDLHALSDLSNATRAMFDLIVRQFLKPGFLEKRDVKRCFEGRSFLEGYLVALGLEGGHSAFNQDESLLRIEQLVNLRNAFQHDDDLYINALDVTKIKTRRNHTPLFLDDYAKTSWEVGGDPTRFFSATVSEEVFATLVEDLKELSKSLQKAYAPWHL